MCIVRNLIASPSSLLWVLIFPLTLGQKLWLFDLKKKVSSICRQIPKVLLLKWYAVMCCEDLEGNDFQTLTRKLLVTHMFVAYQTSATVRLIIYVNKNYHPRILKRLCSTSFRDSPSFVICNTAKAVVSNVSIDYCNCYWHKQCSHWKMHLEAY